MMRHRSVTTLVWTTAASLAVIAGCTSDDPEEATTDDTVVAVPVAAATVPPERQTPFCVAMIDLNTRLLSDPPDDVEAEIIAVYREILPDVPVEIAEDFAAVLVALETGRPLPTTPPPSLPTTGPDQTGADSSDPDDANDTGTSLADGFDAERFELSTPAERITDYVDFACRDTGNNPGPPPTQPLEEGRPAEVGSSVSSASTAT